MVKLQHAAGALFSRRRERQHSFESFSDLFADPAWDMLLLLYKNHRQLETMVSTVCDASQAYPSTALRLLTTLEERGLLRRFKNPKDYRSKLVELTDAGVSLVRRGLAAGAD